MIENHDEINQPLEIKNPQGQQDHTVTSHHTATKNQYLEINQEHLVFHEVAQQGQVDQAPLLVDQDQIGRISKT